MVLFFGAQRVLSGDLSVGELTVFLTYLKTAFKPMRDISKYTARIAKAAFPKGNLYLRLRDELGTLYTDEDFAHLYPTHGQPGLPAG